MNTRHLLHRIFLASSLVALLAASAACTADSDADGAAGKDGIVNNGGNDVTNNGGNNATNNGWSGNNGWDGNNGSATNNSGNNATNNGWSGNNGANNGTNNGTSNATNGGSNTNNGGGNTNVALGGAQDFGYFRRLLDANRVPERSDIDAAGFFAEHHSTLPEPVCGERICVQPMLGVMGNLMNGSNCTMLQIGLNSPIVADESQRPPLTLSVVVDVSGSMRANGKIDFVRQGLSKLINEMNDDDQIAIITYGSSVNTAFPMGELQGQRNVLQDIAAGLEPGGSTNLYGGLEAGYQTVFDAYDSGRQNRVILLSDGEPTAGITSPTEIVAMSRAYNSDGVGLTTIGLGTDFNFDLMRTLAEQADGNYYFLEDAGAVDDVFTEELSYFTVPVAFDLSVDMHTGSHYDFGRAVGSPFWEDTDYGGRIEVPSVFLAHRTSHSDVTENGGRRGGGSALLVELQPKEVVDDGLETATVATVDLQFREPGTDRIVTESLEVNYPHNPWLAILQGYFQNDVVTKSFVMLNILAALEMSCDMFHLEGDPVGGIALLQRVIAAAADYEDGANLGEGDVDIQFDIELMEQMIEVLLANGGRQPENNELPEDPWPAD